MSPDHSDPIPQQPSCQDETDKALAFDAARALVDSRVRPVGGREVLALRSALGRVLDRPLISPADVPPHRNSAMDGYALDGNDLPPDGSRELQVVGTSWAGAPYSGPAQVAGQCVRIMTGGKMPETADTVVMQEQAPLIGEERIRIGSGHRRGQHVRHPGEDIRRGQELLSAGKRIGPAELGLLASLGVAEVGVYRRVRAAYFASGDELRSIGEPLGEGDIYDSNRYTLYGMLTEMGVDMIDMGVVPDRPDDLAAALCNAADNADLVLTTGGISVGEADHIKRLISEQGQILFSRVRLKPGRPVTFGRWQDSWFFGLPGNPVAAMVAFYQFARPALRRLQGETDTAPKRISARAESALRKRRGRTEIQRGILFRDDEGDLRVRTTGMQGSGVLSSMSRGNCFIFLEDERESMAAGEAVTVEPFEMVRF